MKEIKIMAGLKSEHFVQYYTSWIEINTLYIQMELCYNTLKYIIERKTKEFKRKQEEAMNLMEYYISSELLSEITESLDYLHNQEPPVIHRDLKPSNILITDGSNLRFIKIADLGLVTIHEFTLQTHTQGLGTPKYTAPEVSSGRNYDTKSDIYSLGVIASDLFDVDINSYVFKTNISI
jgi:serine/threonine protein kinase